MIISFISSPLRVALGGLTGILPSLGFKWPAFVASLESMSN